MNTMNEIDSFTAITNATTFWHNFMASQDEHPFPGDAEYDGWKGMDDILEGLNGRIQFHEGDCCALRAAVVNARAFWEGFKGDKESPDPGDPEYDGWKGMEDILQGLG